MAKFLCLLALSASAINAVAISSERAYVTQQNVSEQTETMWTPPDFNWAGFKGRYGVVYMDVTDQETTSSGVNTKALVASGAPMKEIGDRKFLSIATAIGLVWQAANIWSTATTAYSAVQSCTSSQGSFSNRFSCANSVISTITGFGGLASVDDVLARHGAKGAVGFLSSAVEKGAAKAFMSWVRGGRASIGNSKRAALTEEDIFEQQYHHWLMERSLQRIAIGEPEFLGFLEDDHVLSRRDNALHPLTPSYRYHDKRHGPMEFASRATKNGTFVTFAPAGHPTHLLGRRAIANLKAKRVDYEEEYITEGIAAGRFDVEASQADPNNLGEPDSENMYNMVEDAMNCYTPDNEPNDGSVLSAQFYDQTNMGTYAFTSSGYFPTMDDVENFVNDTPSGMPLPVCGS